MMLANSLRRIWSAKRHVPHLTGWGTCDSQPHGSTKPTPRSMYERLVALFALAYRSAPIVLVIVWNLTR